ncbi:ABC transporter permease [Lysinibacillus xylanilyticus]|uniref:ABC transporter permease n=1 Tax=Lysinibacillus xylanilyticus TaxID=582475 RepID=UPI002E248747|nr:ABC transporter permease [Lysinibacillus xylanilyticus]
MGNLLKSELFKLKKDRSFRKLTLALMIIAALFPLIASIYGAKQFSVNELFISIIGRNNYVLKIIPCLLAGYFISSEYSLGTMKSIASSGNSRIRIYISKLMVFSFGAIIFSLILPIAMTGTGAIFAQFNDMPDLKYFVQINIFTMLYAAAFASIMMLFATMFTDSGKTIGLLILLFLLFDGVMFMLASKFSLFEYIYNNSVFKLLYDIININTMDSIEVLKLALIPILTYLVFGLLGIFAFLKKEIK